MRLPQVPMWAWAAYFGLGLVLEGLALANGLATGDTATEVIYSTLPGWLVYMGIGWLAWHFRGMR